MKKIILIGLMWMIILGVFVTAATTPAPTGLIAWWQGQDNANDVFKQNNGILKGDAKYDSGKVGKAFSFDGDGDYVEIPDNEKLTLPAITIEAWVKATWANDDLNSIPTTIISKYKDSTDASWSLYTKDRKLIFELKPCKDCGYEGVFQSNTDFEISPNKWHHVAATFNSSSIKIYVNGTLKKEDYVVKSGTIYDSTALIRIGATNFNGNAAWFWKGLIDEVSIYNRALSLNEIKKIYKAKIDGKQIPSCGDGKKEGNEGCDDENLQPEDGCDDKCQIEQGYICKEGPTGLSTCSKYVCGDGKKEGNEGCDDKNLQPGDGCNQNCQVEANYFCSETKGLSTCTKQICEPFKYSCKDATTYQQCDSTGLNYKSEGTCAPGRVCEGEGNCVTPKQNVCVKDTWVCDSNTAKKQCNSDGTDYINLINCPEGQTCTNGECKAQPENQQCNPLSEDITALNENDKALVTKIIEALQKDDSLLKLDSIITSLKDWIKLVLQG